MSNIHKHIEFCIHVYNLLTFDMRTMAGFVIYLHFYLHNISKFIAQTLVSNVMKFVKEEEKCVTNLSMLFCMVALLNNMDNFEDFFG